MTTATDSPLQDPSPDCDEEHEHDQPRHTAVSDDAVARASAMFRAVGDESRLRLLELLAQGEACVTELAAASNDGLSTVSQRLRVLRDCDLVTRRREGKHIYYALADEHVAQLIFNVFEHAAE